MNQEELLRKINGIEDEHCEFKEAKCSLGLDTLYEYCVALANEKGGSLILGVTDKSPRNIVGTSAFNNLNDIKRKLNQKLGKLGVSVEEYFIDDKRILVFNIPSRPTGVPLDIEGRYVQRNGEELISMKPDRLKLIFEENNIDISREPLNTIRIEDLDPIALTNLRNAWLEKSKNKNILNFSDSEMLENLGLSNNNKLNKAALILLGKTTTLSKILPQAEIIVEFRNSEHSIDYQNRLSTREGLFTALIKILNFIEQRIEIRHYQQGLFNWDIPNFRTEAIREALLNAVSHRDYSSTESIIIKQTPNRLTFESPGGLPEGITVENIIDRTKPRNRTITEVLEKTGLVERSGIGVDMLFESSIKDSKKPPDYSETDNYRVIVTLFGEVQDQNFLHFVEEVNKIRQNLLSFKELIVLDYVRDNKRVPKQFKNTLDALYKEGLVEMIKAGRNPKYMLTKRYYTFINKRGSYTKDKGLNKVNKKSLIMSHFENFSSGSIKEFEQILLDCSRAQIHSLLKELKEDNKIEYIGARKMGFWQKKCG